MKGLEIILVRVHTGKIKQKHFRCFKQKEVEYRKLSAYRNAGRAEKTQVRAGTQ